ncbi:MAG: hypothetical protein Q4E75_02550 [bacterium]|nr:hypothetical protein [bacterium]
MNNYSLIDKLKILVDVASSSSLFLFCSMIFIFALIFYFICKSKSINISKWVFIGIWTVLALILIIYYNKYVLQFLDSFTDFIFSALYFPNFYVYTSIILIINFYLLFSIISNKIKKPNKIVNICSGILIDAMLGLIIGIVNNYNINVNDTVSTYSNPKMLVMLQLSSSIFASWLLLNLLCSAYLKLKKYDKDDYPKMQEIIFEDV